MFSQEEAWKGETQGGEAERGREQIVESRRKTEGNNFAKNLKSLHNSQREPKSLTTCRKCGRRKLEVYAMGRSSWKERKGNALASGAEEGRDKLR